MDRFENYSIRFLMDMGRQTDVFLVWIGDQAQQPDS